MGKNNNWNNNNSKQQNTDKNGRALTKNGNYYSSARMGFTKEQFTYLDRATGKEVTREKFWVNGHNISKTRGKLTFSGVENSKSLRYEGKKKGKKHIMLYVEVFFHRTGNTVVEYIDVCMDSGTAEMKKMNMFIDFHAKGGGSWTNKVK